MMQAPSMFGHYGGGESVPRQWVPALFTSSIIYVGVVMAATMLTVGRNRLVRQRPPVEMKFVETVVKEEPPPKPVEEAKPPPPVVPKEKPVQRLVKPPPKELVVPKELPKEVPAEAEPNPNQPIAVWEPDESKLQSGYRTTGGQKQEITEEMQGVTRAKPFKSNEPPPYPKTARNAWKTDNVVLKIRITAAGRVTDVQVVQGEEPFVSEAVNTVKGWRYYPAHYQGKPVTVYRIIKIAFKLT